MTDIEKKIKELRTIVEPLRLYGTASSEQAFLLDLTLSTCECLDMIVNELKYLNKQTFIHPTKEEQDDISRGTD